MRNLMVGMPNYYLWWGGSHWQGKCWWPNSSENITKRKGIAISKPGNHSTLNSAEIKRTVTTYNGIVISTLVEQIKATNYGGYYLSEVTVEQIEATSLISLKLQWSRLKTSNLISLALHHQPYLPEVAAEQTEDNKSYFPGVAVEQIKATNYDRSYLPKVAVEQIEATSLIFLMYPSNRIPSIPLFHRSYTLMLEHRNVPFAKPRASLIMVYTDGGVLCNSRGGWLLGFNRQIGICTVLQAEFWAIADGLRVAWDARFRMIELDCYNAKAISLVKGNSFEPNVQQPMGVIRELRDKEWQVKFTLSCRLYGSSLEWPYKTFAIFYAIV
ncbi:hypothetical protein Gotur_033639 [Gossypium turneri]